MLRQSATCRQARPAFRSKGKAGLQRSVRVRADPQESLNGTGLPIARRPPRRNLPAHTAQPDLHDDSFTSANLVPIRQQPQSVLPSKQELKGLSLELEAKTQELQEATRHIGQLQEQVAVMQAALQCERRELRDVRAQLLDAQMSLSSKDDTIRGLYESLLDATRERGDLRQQLIGTQQQLKKTEAELTSWTEGLYALKTVIDSMDDEDDLAAGLVNGSAGGSVGGGTLLNLPTTTELLAKPDENATLLQALAALSRSILEDCEKDEEYLRVLEGMDNADQRGQGRL